MKIEFNSGRDILIVDGVQLDPAFIKAVITPNPKYLYRFYEDETTKIISIEQYTFADIEKFVTRP